MPGPLNLIKDFLPQTSAAPAVAAAVTVLHGAFPPPLKLNAALRAVAPDLSDVERAGWVALLGAPLQKAAITTPRCLAAFLGQCAHESAGFRALEEDLSYSAMRLCQVWPSRFPTLQVAEACALQPESLANRVYADRLGNGGAETGDGWRFRGRGLIQITGRTAYQHFARSMGMTVDAAVDHAATQAGAADSATWFWTANNLNALARTWSIDLLTRKINGGMAGAAERLRRCEAALRVLGS